MKAIVLEIKNGYAAVLREDGVITKTRQPCQVGDTIELVSEVVPFPIDRKKLLRNAVAAVLALSLAGGSYGYTTAMAASYVSLDVDGSSVEFSVNRVGRVIAVKSINDDGKALAETLNQEVRSKKLDDAMDVAMVRLRDEGYLTGTVIAGVTADKEEKRAEMAHTVERSVIRHSSKETQVVTLEATRSERGEARKLDQSAGRFLYEHQGLGRPPRPEGEDEEGVSWGIGLHAYTPEEEEETPPETEQTPPESTERQAAQERQNTENKPEQKSTTRNDSQNAQSTQNSPQSSTPTGGNSGSNSETASGNRQDRDSGSAQENKTRQSDSRGDNQSGGSSRSDSSQRSDSQRTGSGTAQTGGTPEAPRDTARPGEDANRPTPDSEQPGSPPVSPTEQPDSQTTPPEQPDSQTNPPEQPDSPSNLPEQPDSPSNPTKQPDSPSNPTEQPDSPSNPAEQPDSQTTAPEQSDSQTNPAEQPDSPPKPADQGIDRSLYPLDPEDEPFLNNFGGTPVNPGGQTGQTESPPNLDGAAVREGNVPPEPEKKPEVTSDAVRENPSERDSAPQGQNPPPQRPDTPSQEQNTPPQRPDTPPQGQGGENQERDPRPDTSAPPDSGGGPEGNV